MNTEFLTYMTLGALAGGFINGLSGTGTALFALGFYLVVFDPMQAVAIVASMSILAGVQGVWIVRHQILEQPARLLRYVLPGLVGVPIGLMILEVIDAGTLRLFIATLLILYGAYFGFRAALPAFSRKTPVLDAGIGFLGGFVGGASGVSGAIPSMWLALRPWTKFETRGVLQPYNMAILSTTVAMLIFKGAYDRTALMALLFTIPIGLLAAQMGIGVFRRLADTTFRRLLILLTLLMGLGILASELF